ncbi:hypothetical protein Aduo_001715 [Ancylostoma duodenale]
MEMTIHDSGKFVRILMGGGIPELENAFTLTILTLSMSIRGGSGTAPAAPPPKPPPPNPAKQPKTCDRELHVDIMDYYGYRQLSDSTAKKHRRINYGDKEETTIQDSGNSVRNLMGGGASENAWSTIMLFMDIGGPGMATAFLKTTCPSPKPPPPKPPKKKTRQPPI